MINSHYWVACFCPNNDKSGIASHSYMYDERNDLHASLYFPKNNSTCALSPSITDIAVLLSTKEPPKSHFLDHSSRQ